MFNIEKIYFVLGTVGELVLHPCDFTLEYDYHLDAGTTARRDDFVRTMQVATSCWSTKSRNSFGLGAMLL